MANESISRSTSRRAAAEASSASLRGTFGSAGEGEVTTETGEWIGAGEPCREDEYDAWGVRAGAWGVAYEVGAEGSTI